MEKIVFLGSGTYTIPIVERLLNHGLVLVVTTEHEGSFVNFLKKNNIPVFISDLQTTDAVEKIKQLQPTIGILASYGAILRKPVMNLFPKGIINIHPSLLPLHKGSTPIQTTILEADTITGVTIHRLDEIVDHGPILAQAEYVLNGTETMKFLKDALFAKGAEMIEEIITKIENGEQIAEKAQDHTKGNFTKKVTRESGFVDLDNPPQAEVLKRMIRAYYPWPGVWTMVRIMNKELRIKILPEEKIQVEGKRVMSYKDFKNGYQKEGEKLLKKLGLV